MSEHEPREWMDLPAANESLVGDAIVASLAAGGVDHLFFTSGSEIAFYQEAIAKARAHGRPAPRIITVTHEHAALNAALGYAAVSGRPAVTAAHVDTGTQHYGGAIHTARHSGLPVLITAGSPPTSYPGAMRGGRDSGGHIWMQQSYDQNGIVRQYMKWDHQLKFQDNPGLTVSRALQVAQSEPPGPVYLSIPREVALLPARESSFPTVQQLGLPRSPAPDPQGIDDLARRLVAAKNPGVIVSGSGRDLRTVEALVKLCERLALPVFSSVSRAYHCFPMRHPLYQAWGSLAELDVVLVLEADIPWVPGKNEPPIDAYVAAIGLDPVKQRIPLVEFTADLRLAAGALSAIEALTAAVEPLLTETHASVIAARLERWRDASAERRRLLVAQAESTAHADPISPIWLSYQIGQLVSDDMIVFDETLAHNPVHEYLQLDRPGSYFYNPASSGGWTPGAALGAKLAAPDRDVIAVAGDGFYMFGNATAAIWSAAHYKAPFLTVVFQNRSYSTGVYRVNSTYPDSYAARAGFEGGYFDPPMDFAKEAEAAGGYGENVRAPGDVAAALRRGLEATRRGTPAVISVWLPRLLRQD